MNVSLMFIFSDFLYTVYNEQVTLHFTLLQKDRYIVSQDWNRNTITKGLGVLKCTHLYLVVLVIVQVPVSVEGLQEGFTRVKLRPGVTERRRPLGQILHGLVCVQVSLEQETLRLWSDGTQIQGATVTFSLQGADHVSHVQTGKKRTILF